MEEVGEDQSLGEDSNNDYEARENLWDQAWPGDSERETVHSTRGIDDENEMSGFPDAVGTRDPLEAARDAEYIQSIIGEIRGVVDVVDEMTIDPDVTG